MTLSSIGYNRIQRSKKNKKERKGRHTLENHLALPLYLSLIFSNFRKTIRFFSQRDTDGGCGALLDNSILRRANNEVKAIASNCILLKDLV